MGHSNCVVCDQCGKHDRAAGKSDAWTVLMPEGWVTVQGGGSARLAYIFCSLACANRAAREAPCSD